MSTMVFWLPFFGKIKNLICNGGNKSSVLNYTIMNEKYRSNVVYVFFPNNAGTGTLALRSASLVTSSPT
jgi:hypothetical protein